MLKIDFRPFPLITTERLLLRQLVPGDAEDLHDLRSNKRVRKYLDRPKESLAEVRYFMERLDKAWADNQSIIWAITPKKGHRLIGAICYFNISTEHHRAEIGYMLLPTYQGKGIMSEALNAVVKYGFETMKLHSMEANVNPANEASIKLLERRGFVREAYFRQNYFFEGKFLDSAIYSLLTEVSPL